MNKKTVFYATPILLSLFLLSFFTLSHANKEHKGGKGFFYTIANNSGEDITTSVSNVQCMQNSVSNLNISLKAGATSPSIYVEDSAKGECLFSASSFTLGITTTSGKSVKMQYNSAAPIPGKNGTCATQTGYCFSWDDGISLGASSNGEIRVRTVVDPL